MRPGCQCALVVMLRAAADYSMFHHRLLPHRTRWSSGSFLKPRTDRSMMPQRDAKRLQIIVPICRLIYRAVANEAVVLVLIVLWGGRCWISGFIGFERSLYLGRYGVLVFGEWSTGVCLQADL